MLEHLNSLLRAVETFAHPSNTSRWTSHVSSFLCSLTEVLTQRIVRDRLSWPPKWFERIPPDNTRQLTDAHITRVVHMVKPLAVLLLFGKTPAASLYATYRTLATLAPNVILPELLQWSAPPSLRLFFYLA